MSKLELYKAMTALLEEAICVLDEAPIDEHGEYGLCWAISRAHENLVTDDAWSTLASAESVLYCLIRNALGIPFTYVTDWLSATHGIRLTDEESRDYRIKWATAILEQAKRERDELRKATTPDEYAENHGAFCPVCQSNDIEGGSFEASVGDAWQSVRCLNCSAQWDDTYELTGYDNLVMRDE